MDDGQHEITENDAKAQTIDYGVKKRRIILMLLAYSAILGITAVIFPDKDPPTDFVFFLPLLILGVSWCFTDAAERNYRMGRLMSLLLILFLALGLPIYLLRTRGFGAFKTLAATLLLVGGMLTCMVVAVIATVYAGNAAGLLNLAR
ncbi:MAG: hypothetical protein WCH39_28040 [Schlesneria sp.]